MALPQDSSFQAHLTAEQEKQPAPTDERTNEQKRFDERVAELEMFSWENKLRAMTINASAGKEIIKIPDSGASKDRGTKPKNAKSLFALLGGDPSLLDKTPGA